MPSLRDRAADDRRWAHQRGDILTSESANRAQNAQQSGKAYQAYADEVYDPLIGGRGGYSPEEQGKILQQDDLLNLRTGDDEYANWQLTPEEQAAMRGNPNAGFNYWDPYSAEQAQHASAGYQRGAYQDMSTELRDAVPIDQLQLSDDYGRNVQSGLGTTEGNVRGAINRDRLTSDPTLGGRYRLTPQQQQDIVTGAGITAGRGYQSAIEQMERQGRAAGLDPLGMAAMRGRLERESAGEAADAMTQARIGANSEAARREMELEKERRAGETSYAGMSSQAEMQLGRDRRAAGQNAEEMRLNAQRDISDRRMTNARVSGQTRLAAEQGINEQEARERQFNTNTGTRLATQADEAATRRAGQVALNRQQTSQTAANTRFQQGTAVNDRLAGRNAQIADARRADAAEGRGYLREQMGAQRGVEQREADRQVGIYGTQGSLSNAATGREIEADRNPRMWERVTGAVMGGAQTAARAFGGGGEHGGVITEPTMMILGESGPEMVVPMNGDSTAETAMPSQAPSPVTSAPSSAPSPIPSRMQRIVNRLPQQPISFGPTQPTQPTSPVNSPSPTQPYSPGGYMNRRPTPVAMQQQRLRYPRPQVSQPQPQAVGA